jgi:hypothetical protein
MAYNQRGGDQQDRGTAEKRGPRLETARRGQLIGRGETERNRDFPEVEREGIHRNCDMVDQAHPGRRIGAWGNRVRSRGNVCGVREGDQRRDSGGQAEQKNGSFSNTTDLDGSQRPRPPMLPSRRRG